MNAKNRHRRKILEYIGNPENDFPTRDAMAVKACGVKKQTLKTVSTVLRGQSHPDPEFDIGNKCWYRQSDPMP